MQTVRQQTPPADYTSICAVTENNRAYPFPGLGNTFPRDPHLVPNYRFKNLRPLDLNRELALQIARLNYHATELVDSLISLAEINEHLARQQTRQAEAAIAQHKEKYGLSFVFLKKDMLFSLIDRGLPGLNKRSREITTEYQRTGWALLSHYIYDVMDPTYNPTRSSRVWLILTQGRMKQSEWYSRLVEDDILINSSSDATLASAL